MTADLSELERVARAARDCYGGGAPFERFMAAFRPETVLALIARAERAEADAAKMRDVVEAARRSETMLRKHAAWTDGIYVRNPEAGRDEDLRLVSLPDHVGIIDMADDIRDALAALEGNA